MHVRVLLLASLLLTLPLAGATVRSSCERAADCTRQMDGGQPGDASNACASPSPTVHVGQTFTGWLAPPVDPEDNFALSVPAPQMELTVSVESAASSTGHVHVEHEVQVYAPSQAGVPCEMHLGTAGPHAPFGFTAHVAGNYTLRVVPLGTAPALQLPAQECHIMCIAGDATGYAVSVVPV